jgi:hydrocephalus-inducing protein
VAATVTSEDAAGGGGGGGSGDKPAELVIDCGPVLGKYRYALSLRATEAGVERTLQFQAPLGSTQSKVFKFNSLLRAKAPTFTARVGQPLFFGVDGPASFPVAAATTWDGTPASVTVVFEPEQVGKVTDVLTVTSPDGGVFRCTLVGECAAPTPQGPFVVKQAVKGGGLQIPFKNVFNNKQLFDFTVDKPALFDVSPPFADLAKKTSTTITVTFKGVAAASGGPTTGRLLVTPRGDSNLPPWVFYLTGEGL